MKKIIWFFLLSFMALSSTAFATDCYIAASAAGSADGTSMANAYAWNADGSTVETCYTDIDNGTGTGAVKLDYDFYELTSAINTLKSGNSSSERIIITTDGAVDDNPATWAIIEGTRSELKYSDTTPATAGIHFIDPAASIDNIGFSHLHLRNFQYVIEGSAGNQDNYFVDEVYAQNIRTFLYVKADPGVCDDGDNVWDCTDGSTGWEVSDVDARGLAKRFLRCEGADNFTFTDVNVDVKDESGGLAYGDNFPFIFWAADGCHDITYTRVDVSNALYYEDATYDNGDCFGGEDHSYNITHNQVSCNVASDSGFDYKGDGIVFTDFVCNDTKRCARCWGHCVINNGLILNSNGDSYYTLDAQSGPLGVWARGVVDLDKVTMVNAQTPYQTVADDGFSSGDMRKIAYDAGNGGTPKIGAFVTGGTSGAKGVIVDYDGNGTTGNIWFNGTNDSGTFSDNESIDDASGHTSTGGSFTATVNGTHSRSCGRVYIDDSIIWCDERYASCSQSSSADCDGESDALVDETNVVKCVDKACSPDPDFVLKSDLQYTGKQGERYNSWNSNEYTNTKGWYLDGAPAKGATSSTGTNTITFF